MPLATIGFILSHPLSGRQPVRSISRYLGWQIVSRIHSPRTVEWVEGTKLVAEAGMTGATGNIYCGLHEFVDMAFLLHLLRPGDLFLDIGANVGSYTVLASGVRRARTIAFEPDPLTCARFKRNMAANGLEALVTLQEAALGSQEGKIAFTAGRDTMNRVAQSGDPDVTDLPMKVLDRVEGTSAPTFMKLDVEGYEAEVLAGAERLLQSRALLAIATEGDGPGVSSVLAANGFRRFVYDPFTRNLNHQLEKGKSHNALFVRDEAEVRRRVSSASAVRVLGASL